MGQRNVYGDMYLRFPPWFPHLPGPSPATALLVSPKWGELQGKQANRKHYLVCSFYLLSYLAYRGLDRLKHTLLPLPCPHSLFPRNERSELIEDFSHLYLRRV